jgi:exopolysaccharide biosynthesis protein
MIPGELSHASNPNPRTVIATKGPFGNELGFFYVEGRMKRGYGMDLVMIAKYLAKLGWEKAINLDGGASSQMIWKRHGDNFVTQVNSAHDFSYPVGSVISLTKMKP